MLLSHILPAMSISRNLWQQSGMMLISQVFQNSCQYQKNSKARKQYVNFKNISKQSKYLRACSQRNESRSESHPGSRSASWLGSWFELRAFTSIANAVPITNRICALRVIFCSYWADWPMRGVSAHFQNVHARIIFRKSFAFTCP